MNDKSILNFLGILILIMIAGAIHAQKNYHPGYIIKSNNDTLQGYILTQNTNQYSGCSFKASLGDNETVYKPFQIESYYLINEGKYYISKTVSIEGIENQYFLEFLIKGKASIYYMRQDIDRYFIENSDHILRELSGKDVTVVNSYGDSYIRENNYQAKLKAALADCKEIYPKIEQTSLTHSSLIKLARNYHEKVCSSEQCIVFASKDSSTNVKLGFYGGVSISKVHFGSQLNSNTKPCGIIGLRMELEGLFKWTNRLSFVTDLQLLQLSTFNFTEKEEELLTYNGVEYVIRNPKFGSKSTYIVYDMDINFKSIVLNIPLIIRYKFPFNGIVPYLGAGIKNSLFLTQNKEFTLDRFYSTYNRSIPSYQVGYLVQTGIEFPLKKNNNLFLEASYENTRTPSVNNFTTFYHKSFNISAGFSF